MTGSAECSLLWESGQGCSCVDTEDGGVEAVEGVCEGRPEVAEGGEEEVCALWCQVVGGGGGGHRGEAVAPPKTPLRKQL